MCSRQRAEFLPRAAQQPHLTLGPNSTSESTFPLGTGQEKCLCEERQWKVAQSGGQRRRSKNRNDKLNKRHVWFLRGREEEQESGEVGGGGGVHAGRGEYLLKLRLLLLSRHVEQLLQGVVVLLCFFLILFPLRLDRNLDTK